MGKLLDDDFLEDGDVSDTDEKVAPEPKPGKEAKDEIAIEIVDDTPDEDKGKWVASDEKDGEPELPNEDELRTYSKSVKKRISELTARLHAERRAREAEVRQFNELTEFTKGLMTENNQIKAVLENGEKVLVGEHKGRLEAQLASARRLLAEAQEAGDANGIATATESIARLASQMDRLSVHTTAPLQRASVEEFEKRYAPRPPQQEASDRAKEWAKKNPWFQNDTLMQAYAIGLHKKLVSEEGISPEGDEYWRRIDSDVRKRFPDKFKDERSAREKPVVVSGVSRGGAAKKVVSLTASQANLAKRLGLSLEQYAQQLVAEEKSSEGMYTHGKR